MACSSTGSEKRRWFILSTLSKQRQIEAQASAYTAKYATAYSDLYENSIMLRIIVNPSIKSGRREQVARRQRIVRTLHNLRRSEERRVGKEGVSTCRARC